jgi:DNA-binding response OmpR family regulator
MAAPLIAVVNHDPVFIRLMENILTIEGYRVLAINDGTAVYEVIKRDKPDAIVLDTWLGERHVGWDLLQVLMLDEITAAIPVLICSSDDPDEVAKKLGPNRQTIQTINKPFDTGELLAAVKKVLHQVPVATRSVDGQKPDGRAP